MKKRIDKILSFVRPCNVFADIGCDHGKVAVSVKKSGVANKVIAADVSADSLQKAVDLADNEHIDGLIAVLSDGFNQIEEAVDEAVIAGMGGEEIIKILSRASVLPDRLILQPMKNAEKLRRYLTLSLGYPVTDDLIFFDGEKYYELIVCDKKSPYREYSEKDYVFGKDNDEKNEDFLRYCKNLADTYRAALAVVGKGESGKALGEKLRAVEEFLQR